MNTDKNQIIVLNHFFEQSLFCFELLLPQTIQDFQRSSLSHMTSACPPPTEKHTVPKCEQREKSKIVTCICLGNVAFKFGKVNDKVSFCSNLSSIIASHKIRRLQRHRLVVIKIIFADAEEIRRGRHAADFVQELFAHAFTDEVHEFFHAHHL